MVKAPTGSKQKKKPISIGEHSGGIVTAEWVADITEKIKQWGGKHKKTAMDLFAGAARNALKSKQPITVDQFLKGMQGRWPGTTGLVRGMSLQPRVVPEVPVMGAPGAGVPLTTLGGLPGGVGVAPPDWWLGKAPAKGIAGSTPKDLIQQVVANMALPYMAGDPTTQAETAQWLARSHPTAYGEYADVPVARGIVPPGQQISAAAIEDLVSRLDYDKLRGLLTGEQQKMLGKEESEQERADIKAGTRWLKEYLQTGAGALGRGKTRAEQLFAKKHMETLMREAQKEPGVSGLYATLAENILNPIYGRAPASGIFGSRALTRPTGDYMRGGIASRSPTAL
jgi:hypothetical protein